MTTERPTEELRGLDWEGLTRWMAAACPSMPPLIRGWLISGGRSNLTFGLEDAEGGQWCLRRPPLGHSWDSAHDVGREYRILTALQNSHVLVPPALGQCTDTEVVGAPFYVTRFVQGHVVGTAETAEEISAAARSRAGRSCVDALLAVHGVDVAAVGLDTLGRPDHYIGRQIRRWTRQVGEEAAARHPQLRRIGERLQADIPVQQGSTLVHGDLKLGNVILAPDGSLRAVLDWELSTLGDPLADIGWLLASWVERGEQAIRITRPPSQVRGFSTRSELVEAYSAASSLDLSRLAYYIAMAEWKWASIDIGIHDRFSSGLMGDAEVDLDLVLAEIDSRLEHADALLSGDDPLRP